MDYSAMFTAWSKMYRDIYNKAHEQIIENWIKTEERVTGETVWSFWKKK